MKDISAVLKKRLCIYFISIIVICLLSLNFLNDKLIPVVYEYGKHQCLNISTKIANVAVEDVLTNEVKKELVTYNNKDGSYIDFNSSILNSLAVNVTKKIHMYFYKLEKGNLDQYFFENIDYGLNFNKIKNGTVYEVPIGIIFNNSLISNLGWRVPVRYQMVGSAKTKIVSELSEYGINNALLKISLQVDMNVDITIPTIDGKENLILEIPLIIKLIQGEIPNFMFGENILSEVN